MINKLPMITVAKNIIPKRLKHFFKNQIFSYNASESPYFSEDVEKYLLDVIRDDSKIFLEHCKKPHNYWNNDPVKSNKTTNISYVMDDL